MPPPTPGVFGDTRYIETVGTLSLEALQTQVRDMEAIIGPFVELGTRGSNNRLAFNVASPPETEVVLAIFGGTSPSGKSGHMLICSGLAWILMKPVKVAAYRPM